MKLTNAILAVATALLSSSAVTATAHGDPTDPGVTVPVVSGEFVEVGST